MTTTDPKNALQTEELQQSACTSFADTLKDESKQAEENPVLQAEHTLVSPPTEEEKNIVFKTKEEILQQFQKYVDKGVVIDRLEIDRLKSQYYKIHKQSVLTAREAFIASGGEAEDFLPSPDLTEEKLREYIHTFNHRRAKQREEIEAQKQKNYQHKLDIIERIKELAQTAEIADKYYNEFKELQAEWKTIKLLPAEKVEELWQSYHFNVELYYDQLQLNREIKAFDFKKNQELKEALCLAAEQLDKEPNILQAFAQLQKLHEEYKEIGPVEKEQKEALWTRFKTASTIINRKHAMFFEQRKAELEANYQKKLALCNRVKEILANVESENKTLKWNEASEQVIAIQNEWKTIGFAPKKQNTEVFESFRSLCDEFFTQKNNFHRSHKTEIDQNLKAKQNLLEKALALKDSENWDKATNEFIELQKKWKEIGTVPYKYSAKIWDEFQAACNHFFERKNQLNSKKNEIEKANLSKKRSLLEALKQLLETKPENTQEQVKKLMKEWREIGFVPFKHKEKLQKQYNELLNQLYDAFNIEHANTGLANFKKGIQNKAENELEAQRHKLYRLFEAKRAELQTYETNISFLTAKSKKGSNILQEITRNVEKLQRDLEYLRKKIEIIDNPTQALASESEIKEETNSKTETQVSETEIQ